MKLHIMTVASLRALVLWRQNVACIPDASFTIVSYDRSCEQWRTFTQLALRVQCIDTTLSVKGFHPKGVFQCAHFENVSNGTDLLALADEDIDFCSFDWNDFQRKWLRMRPVVSQPTIISKRGRQVYWPFNHNTWDDVPPTSLMRINLVEQQIPFMDARFARHFWSEIGCTVAKWQDAVSGGWGLDMLWCAAARQWAPARQPCAVVVTPIGHRNMHTIAKHSAYIRSSAMLMKRANTEYPHLFLTKAQRSMYTGRVNRSLILENRVL